MWFNNAPSQIRKEGSQIIDTIKFTQFAPLARAEVAEADICSHSEDVHVHERIRVPTPSNHDKHCCATSMNSTYIL